MNPHLSRPHTSSVKAIPSLPSIKTQIEQKNKEDQMIVKKKLEKMVEKSFPYLAGKVEDIQLLEELDYIRVMYQRPLPIERKILLRTKVLQMLESDTVSKDVHFGMIQLLQEYQCL